MAYGIKISKEGFNANTTEENNLVFTSQREGLKHYIVGTETINCPSVGTYGKTINHWLGYAPVFLAMIKVPGNNFWYPMPSDESIGCYNYIFSTNSSLQIKLVLGPNSTFGTYYVKYYIFANSIIPQPLPRISSEGPWLDVVYADMTLGVNFSKPSPTPGIIKDANYGDLSFGG